jgi:hypothetical protein
MSIDRATLEHLRELAEAGKAGGWQEVLTALDIGDIVVRIRERGDRGDLKAAVEATGMSAPTLWRRAKLAGHRDVVERERPANLTEALRLVQKLEAEAKAGDEEQGDEPQPSRGGRPKRDPLEVLTEQLRNAAGLLARQDLMTEDDAVGIVREAYARTAGATVVIAELAADPEPEQAIVEAPKASVPKSAVEAEPEGGPELLDAVRKALRAEQNAKAEPPPAEPQRPERVADGSAGQDAEEPTPMAVAGVSTGEGTPPGPDRARGPVSESGWSLAEEETYLKAAKRTVDEVKRELEQAKSSGDRVRVKDRRAALKYARFVASQTKRRIDRLREQIAVSEHSDMGAAA